MSDKCNEFDSKIAHYKRNSDPRHRPATLNRIAGLIKQMTADILGPDGHVQGRVDLLCKDEEAAKEHAKQLVDGHAVEL